MWALHQQLHNTIYHVTEAQFHDCWKVVIWTEDLVDLQQKKPEDLYNLAKQIVDQLSSNFNTIKQIDLQPEDECDHIIQQSVLWNCDALRYVDLNELEMEMSE